MAYDSKTQQIGKVIEKLSRAKSDKDFDEICILLEDIYIDEGVLNENFRHEYSSISGKINELSQQQECDLDLLLSNMDYLYFKCQNRIFVNNLFKLKDHINLEVFRMKYADKKEENLKANIAAYESAVSRFTDILDREEDVVGKILSMQNDIQKKNNDLSKTQEEIQKKNDDLSDTHKKLQNTTKGLYTATKDLEKRIEDNTAQFVSILGIFASVLLAFIGGIAFTDSVLNNIDKASIYRIIMVIAIIGFVMYNTIYMLLKFIERFTYRDNNAGFGKSYIAVNVIMVAIMVVNGFFWWSGTVEQRNNKIENRYTIQQSE